MKKRALIFILTFGVIYLIVNFWVFWIKVIGYFIIFKIAVFVLSFVRSLHASHKGKLQSVNINNLKDGDMLLCKGTDVVSRLIKWGTGSEYSHVAVVGSAKLGLIIEAISTGGVRAIDIKNYKTPYDVYRVKEGYIVNISGVVSYLVGMLARGYDFVSVTKLGWKMLLRKGNLVKLLGLKVCQQKKAADSLQEEEDYFCSELCYKAFDIGGGLDIVPNVEQAETTSPADISKSPLVEKLT